MSELQHRPNKDSLASGVFHKITRQVKSQPFSGNEVFKGASILSAPSSGWKVSHFQHDWKLLIFKVTIELEKGHIKMPQSLLFLLRSSDSS